MKKVIDGKLYNTETAKRIGIWCEGDDPTDYFYREEILYLTKSGNYFLSRYGIPEAGTSEESVQEILPLTFAGAERWAWKKLSGDEYLSLFGKQESDDDERVVMSISVPRRTRDILQREKEKSGKSISAIIAECVDNLL